MVVKHLVAAAPILPDLRARTGDGRGPSDDQGFEHLFQETVEPIGAAAPAPTWVETANAVQHLPDHEGRVTDIVAGEVVENDGGAPLGSRRAIAEITFVSIGHARGAVTLCPHQRTTPDCSRIGWETEARRCAHP